MIRIAITDPEQVAATEAVAEAYGITPHDVLHLAVADFLVRMNQAFAEEDADAPA
jgi:hypothetical protein